MTFTPSKEADRSSVKGSFLFYILMYQLNLDAQLRDLTDN